jgi:hypothetical protein
LPLQHEQIQNVRQYRPEKKVEWDLWKKDMWKKPKGSLYFRVFIFFLVQCKWHWEKQFRISNGAPISQDILISCNFFYGWIKLFGVHLHSFI